MSDENFSARRQAGREAAGRFQSACESDGRPLDWFEQLYNAANGDPAVVPWADLEPHQRSSNGLLEPPSCGGPQLDAVYGDSHAHAAEGASAASATSCRTAS